MESRINKLHWRAFCSDELSALHLLCTASKKGNQSLTAECTAHGYCPQMKKRLCGKRCYCKLVERS